MSEFITLTCPSCGGKLQITTSMERFACEFCGNEHVVIRQGGVVYLKPIIETLQNIQVGTDKTVSELAIARLKNEIDEIEKVKKEIIDSISRALKDPNKFRDVKRVLGSRRKSSTDRFSFQESADSNSLVREIQNLSPEEIESLENNVTIRMIRINVTTLASFEKALHDKHHQLSQHQKVVNSQ